MCTTGGPRSDNTPMHHRGARSSPRHECAQVYPFGGLGTWCPAGWGTNHDRSPTPTNTPPKLKEGVAQNVSRMLLPALPADLPSIPEACSSHKSGRTHPCMASSHTKRAKHNPDSTTYAAAAVARSPACNPALMGQARR